MTARRLRGSRKVISWRFFGKRTAARIAANVAKLPELLTAESFGHLTKAALVSAFADPAWLSSAPMD
jgi:hypothetical protein